MIDYEEYKWSATKLLCDKFYQISNAKTYVFADSVLCLGGAKKKNLNEAWKEKIKWYFESNHVKDLIRIDGEPMEFEWITFPGFTTCGFLEEIQKCGSTVRTRQFDGIIFTSETCVWRGNAEKCEVIS